MVPRAISTNRVKISGEITPSRRPMLSTISLLKPIRTHGYLKNPKRKGQDG